MKELKRLFTKEELLTIPNILSYFRLALIPIIVWLYCFEQNFKLAIIAITVSALTDIVDGFIARKFNMVSDFGKIIDPIADKLTQGTVILCLTMQYDLMIGLVIFFVIKEFLIAFLGWLIIKRHDVVNSAKWFGKVNTVVLYFSMMFLLLFPSMNTAIANIIILICFVSMSIALLLYIRFFMNFLLKKNNKK